MPTIQELATEFGLDLTGAKPEFFAKANGYFSDAEKQYSTANQLKTEAEANLRRVQDERADIDKYIADYGANEQTIAALQANNAAMAASLTTLKNQGLNVDIPNAPAVQQKAGKPEFDAAQFENRVGSVLAQGFNLNNKYQRLYGQPLPDDIDALANEAQQARKPLMEYAAQKYDFAGVEKRKTEAAQSTRDAQIAADAVKKYQEQHPVTNENPFQSRGIDSRHSQIFKPREAKDLRQFAGMTAREKIAASVARTRELATANQ
jgi:hypothetical protein